MKKVLASAFVLLLLVSSYSCMRVVGEGPVVTQNRAISGFTRVQMSLSGNLYFRQDNSYKVEIQAQQNIIDVIETSLIGNELVVRIKNGTRIKSYQDVNVVVSSPVINGLAVSGSGSIKTMGLISTNGMQLSTSGSGDVLVPDLTATLIDANISGSGSVVVQSGVSDAVDTRISGSGSIDLANVVSKTAVTRTSGSGTTKVNASQSLNVDISGSGKVYYRGNPVITLKSSGSGKLIHL